jgi:multidrug resistance efflux pump
MSDELSNEPGETESSTTPTANDPVRRFTQVVLVVLLVLMVWYVLADRHAPWTDQARVHGLIIPLSPKVSGKVKEIHVVDNQIVEEGQVLVKLDPRTYELAVERAEAQLERAGQGAGVNTAEVASAVARLATVRAQLTEAKQQHDRIERMFKAEPGAVSGASRDRVKAALSTAQSAEAAALADVERAKQQLGGSGKKNAQVREAAATLAQAQIDLADTNLKAPSMGGITNFKLDEGYYAKAGVPLLTFVSGTDVWVQANLRENNLEHVKPGAKVDILLDQLPGRIFKGVVESKGFAVKQSSYGVAGDLVDIKGSSGWLQNAQRFPVIIRFADESAYGYRAAGGRVDVQIYGSNEILNNLGWAWIRLLSVLSFIY